MLPLAACGGGSTSGPTTTPPPSPTPTPSPTPQPSPSLLIHTINIPSPGASPAIVPTDTHDVSGSYTVATGSVLLAAPGAALFTSSDSSLNFTNNGALWAVGDNTIPLSLDAHIITNNGTIVSKTDTSSNYGIGAFDGDVVNNGTVYAISPSGQPAAIYSEGVGHSISNTGEAYAESTGTSAYSILVYGTFGNVNNSGTLHAASGDIAVGIALESGGSVTNSGTIVTEPIFASDGGDNNAFSAGVVYYGGTDNALTNSGHIFADVSVSSQTAVTITNSGYLGGAVLLSDQADHVTNTGEIDGPVLLFAGDDVLDSQNGTLDYFVDGGDGNDVINGSAGADEIYGGNGDDTLYGYGGDDRLDGGLDADELHGGEGNDWIYGARGNDTLDGGAGNDGLYGGLGDDQIMLEGADRAEGGYGDDTFSVVDREFALIDGGDGNDTLVLAGAAMSLDLSAFAADNRLANLEVIDLGTSDIALDGAALDAITGASADLHVHGDASNTVALVGSGWTDLGTVVDGETYHEYSNGSKAIYISDAANIEMDGSTPAGYDGPAAPTAPGTAPELGVVSDTYYVTSAIPVSGDFHVYADEAFTKTGGGNLFTSYEHSTSLENAGSISSIAIGDENTWTINASSIGLITGAGDITATAEDGNATCISVNSFGTIDYSGNLTATSTGALATGIITYDAGTNPVTLHGGTINVSAGTDAVGILVENGGDITVDSDVTVEGVHSAIGIEMDNHTANVMISQDLIVVSDNPDMPSVGIKVLSSPLTTTEIQNSGLIQADTAIQCNQSGSVNLDSDFVDHITNDGTIYGDIYTNIGDDVVTNNGSIYGDVFLGEGNDTYMTGENYFDGMVDGGDGTDTLSLLVSGDAVGMDILALSASNFERLDITGSGDNALNFTLQDVLDITDSNNQLTILGDAGDSVTSAAEGWVQGADQTIDSNLFHVYTLDTATLFVDADINQTIL